MNSTIYIVVFSILLLVLLTIKGTKKKLFMVNNCGYLIKEETNWLRGIAIILIMYSHYYEYLNITYNSGVISQVSNFGFLGVAIFFFLSGYATMISKINKPNYLNRYILKRSVRIYIPFLLSFILCIIIMICMGEFPVLSDLCGFPVLSLPHTLNWYLKVQFIMYIVFYVLALLIKDNKKLIISIFMISYIYMLLGYIMHINNYWYESAYLFPLGMLFALYKERIYDIIRKISYLIFSIIFSIIAYGGYFLYGGVLLEIVFIFGFLQLLLCIGTYTMGNSKILGYLGTISLEIYLMHTVILNIVRSKLEYQENIFTFICFLLISIAFSILVNKSSIVITKKINKYLVAKYEKNTFI